MMTMMPEQCQCIQRVDISKRSDGRKEDEEEEEEEETEEKRGGYRGALRLALVAVSR